MVDERIETAVTKLTRLRDDIDACRDILERTSHAMLQRPALGGQLIALICAVDEDDPSLEALSDLLGATLDTARMAQENSNARGDALLSALTEAVEMASGQERLVAFHRMILASAWARSRLPAPSALELTGEDIDAAGLNAPAPDGADADDMLDKLFGDLISQTNGDAHEIYNALRETFPAMPAEVRANVIAWSATRREAVHAQLSCLWLLDPEPDARRVAAQALAHEADARRLSPELTGRMAMLRSWMPDDDARAFLDQALKNAMRNGITQGDPARPWTIHSILATLPDGGGAQSVMIALQSGQSRKVGMLLFKQGHGVKDAYALPCGSATEQRALRDRLVEETDALAVPFSWLESALGMALADGLAVGRPPAPGLIDVAELCGLTAQRPEPVTIDELIATLPMTESIEGMSPQARGKLINASDGWSERHEVLQSWFEESDAAHAAMAGKRSERALETALWKYLETRRDFWARLTGRAAQVLSAADHPDAKSFTATAMALKGGRSLRKVPIMEDVHDQTIGIWLAQDAEADDDTGPIELEMRAADPRPEREGELARFLKGSGISPDWVDGFLMSVSLAPKPISPSQWLQDLMGAVISNLNDDTFQRFVDLIMMRTNASLDQADTEDGVAVALSARSEVARQDWAAGFSHACGEFKSSWPAKLTAPDDRTMIKRVSTAAQTGFSPVELKIVSQWIAARHNQNASG
ncbi:UPF0149 family protein [Roseovarius sp. D22-M7]|uniref:UPF0149 family protein n=1 Tax=Roseovarius sp. D22-M7 TaxID=3127116 RepID=UPI00300FFF09